MEKYFITIVSMSCQAGIAVCFIIIARALLGILKAPKSYSYTLWGIPFIRMVCPVFFDSVLSMLPKESTSINIDAAYNQTPLINTESYAADAIINRGNAAAPALEAANSYAGLQFNEVFPIAIRFIWLFGVLALITYSVTAYIRLKRKLNCSILYRENIYLADYIDTPFTLGFLKPCIYLPSNMDKKEMDYVILHEKVHIKRYDHIIKTVMFLITCVHWFNPLAWAAFLLCGRDMEMSCDEAVMKQLKCGFRQEYASVLLKLTAGNGKIGGIGGIPIAFGKGDTKGRIKNIMSYKKPKAIAVIFAGILLMVLVIGLLTNPDKINENNSLLKKSIQNISKETKQVMLSDIVPFKWTKVYVFAPYVSVNEQEAIMGIESSKLSEGVNEGMLNLVFLNGEEVVSNITGYSENLGYDISLSDQEYTDNTYIVLSYDQNPVFMVEQDNDIVRLSHISSENVEPENNAEQNKADKALAEKEYIEIKEPSISPDMNLGADGVKLDYAGNDITIFHGYFGLYVFSMENVNIIRAIDLEPIGCQYTQGDNTCEVRVSSDGKYVYMHPLSQKDMYVYEVEQHRLYRTEYSLDGISLFDGLVRNDLFGAEHKGYVSEEMLELSDQESSDKYYSYLYSEDSTLGSLCYIIESDMLVMLFSDYFSNSTEDMLNSDELGLSVEDFGITRDGAKLIINNGSDKPIMYGESYRLQTKTDNEWKGAESIIDDWAFKDIGYIIPPHEMNYLEVDWSWLYGSLENGEYKLIKVFMEEQDDGRYENYQLEVEFKIIDYIAGNVKINVMRK